ncbi:hypothetical protein ABZ490_20630 [Streptomyces sp. NPDC005811]|uniref:hypothetical protein n=1 Tax=Streptomyces sp. NPDC005811 TaxID=3154565 RepID=UPI0033DDA645
MASSDSPAAVPTPWDAALSEAFGILLGGEPAAGDLDDPAARYGVYYADDSLDEFLFPNTWITPETLTDPAPGRLPLQGGDEYVFSPSGWRFDLSASLFRFDAHLLDATGPWGEGGHKGPRPFGEDFVADVRAAALDGAPEVLLLGADLGPLLRRHGVDPADPGTGRLNVWLTVLLRVATDGTLTDAMRAATFTADGPGHLTSFDAEERVRTAEPRWEDALAAIPDAGLRDHLRLLCLDEEDARDGGAHCTGGDRWPCTTDVLDDLGCSLVTGWEFGESQAGTAVVRLPVAPPVG